MLTIPRSRPATAVQLTFRCTSFAAGAWNPKPLTPDRLLCLQAQALSSRPDVLPPSITDELEKLQDAIPPFSDAQAMQILADELGRSPESVFSELTPQPVAAASLGQVSLSSTLNPQPPVPQSSHSWHGRWSVDHL